MPEDTYRRMLPLLKDLERRRRKYFLEVQKGSLILVSLGAAIAILTLVMKMADYTSPISLHVPGVVAAFFILMGILSILSQLENSDFLRKYQKVFRTLLVPELLKTLQIEADYCVTGGTSGKAFKSLSFFSTPHDQFHSSDKITGSVEGVNFSISYVHSEINTHTQAVYVTQFEGFFLMMEFHKDFNGRTYVLPDKAERFLGKSGRSLQKAFKRSGTSLIQLEDTEFEKAFAVYATDEVEARYILSHSMMKRLLDLHDRFGAKIRFSFRDNFVCLTIPTSRNHLLPKPKTPSTDEKQFHLIYRRLKMLLGIIEDLDLTTRIWSKT